MPMPETSVLENALLVLPDGTTRDHYELVHLRYNVAGQARCVNFVAIAQIAEGGYLVGAPESAWARTTAERLLPRTALKKALQVEVATATVNEPDQVLAEPSMKIWVGVLEPKLVARLEAGPGEDQTCSLLEEVEDLGGEVVMPYGPALAGLAEENFAFASAASGMEGEEAALPNGEGQGDRDLETRMKQMEGRLGQIQGLLERQLGVVPPKERQSALRSGSALPKTTARVQIAEHPVEIRGLDPTVVSSALQAGIPQEQLVTLSSLLRKSSRMEDVPRKKTVRGVLSESEDEEEEEGAEDADPGQSQGDLSGEQYPAVAKAVLQLTKIVGSLANQKSKHRDLDSMLDLAEGGSADSSSSSSSSRSKAAAFKKLRGALTEAPEKLTKAIEEAIDEDFLQVRMSPGVSSQDFSTRAWVEHRSKLQHYPQTIRMAWILAGAHDAMRQKRFEEAKARILLGIVALDQASLDGGNWALAQEVLLEPAAPFHSFVGRKLPEVWEQTTSKLLDDRVADVLMWRLKDRDSFVEARKRLQVPKPGNPRPDAPANPVPKANPKKAPKAKGKGGGKTAPEEEPSAAN